MIRMHLELFLHYPMMHPSNTTRVLNRCDRMSWLPS